jgi:hypothetical protein
MHRSEVFLTFIFVLIIWTSVASAGIDGQSVGIIDLTDQRSFGSDIYAPPSSTGGLDGNWDTFGGNFFLSWNVYQTTPGLGELWTYEYTLWDDATISNFILEVSEGATLNDFTFITLPDGVTPQLDSWTKSGNHDLPGDPIYGLKFENMDLPSLSIAFSSYKDPVWGNFHAMDGQKKPCQGCPKETVEAYNAAYSGADNTDKINFVVRPDGGSNPPVVPEPVSSALFIIGGSVLGGRLYWRRRKK